MIRFYLAPTCVLPFKQVGISHEPVAIPRIRELPGFRRVSCHLPAGPLVPYTLVRIDADDPRAVDPRMVPLGSLDGLSLASWLRADGIVRPVSGAIRHILQALGLPTTPATRHELFYRIGHRLCPALHDWSYDLAAQLPPQTITDDFNRADGGLGANWTTLLGTWAIVSNQAFQTDTGAVFYSVRRSESAFPDDGYAQVKGGQDGVDALSAPGFRLQADGSGYMLNILTGTSVELRVFTAPSTFTFIDSGTTTTNADDTLYTWRITGTGTSLVVAKDASTVITTTDATYTSGKPGMFAIRDLMPFDDFESSDATATAKFFVLSRF